MPKPLTVEESAELLRVGVETVQRYVREGKLPASKVGRRYLIPEEAVKALLEPKEPPPPSGAAFA